MPFRAPKVRSFIRRSRVSRLRSVWGWLRRGKRKSAGNRLVLPRIRTKVFHGRFRPKVEALAERVLPAITATFSADGSLTVVGDALDNSIIVSRGAAGTILVNGGGVAIQGGQPTVANTR